MGPCSACQGDGYSGSEEPGTLLPCLTYLHPSQLEKPHLCISVSLLGIYLARGFFAQRGFWKAAGNLFISELDQFMKGVVLHAWLQLYETC